MSPFEIRSIQLLYPCTPQINSLADLGLKVTPEFRQRKRNTTYWRSLKNLEPWVLASTLGDPISLFGKIGSLRLLRDEILFLRSCGHDSVKIQAQARTIA